MDLQEWFWFGYGFGFVFIDIKNSKKSLNYLGLIFIAVFW